ncbi:OmpA family protein [uncultured Thiodictyon sp.]|uniref:OmpA family protein n=1 Tax=uncultured Thiodictyon sp. TaxID=1846217 RepID=UPI0025E47325|nr:OmpA family protein [uncultured Thiodictyon sp.]
MSNAMAIHATPNRAVARRWLNLVTVMVTGGVLALCAACTPQSASDTKATERILTDTLRTLNAANQKIAELEKIITDLQAGQGAGELNKAFAGVGACLSDRGFVFILWDSDLQFAPGESKLPDALPQKLQPIAALLTQFQQLTAKVEGFTDNTGQEAANLTLSAARAAAVKAALVKLGVAPERIQTEGLGSTHPVANNQTPEGRSRNRRVEVYITQQ